MTYATYVEVFFVYIWFFMLQGFFMFSDKKMIINLFAKIQFY